MTRVGVVKGVDISTEKNQIFVDVELSPTEVEDDIRYLSPGVGVWFVPEEGDIVEVKSFGRNRSVAMAPYNTPGPALPSGLSEGDIAFRLNDSTVLHFRESNGSYDITLECDGDLNIDAQNIFVGENGTKVATADHTHNYSWTDSGGSGTTDPENEDPTDTEIE